MAYTVTPEPLRDDGIERVRDVGEVEECVTLDSAKKHAEWKSVNDRGRRRWVVRDEAGEVVTQYVDGIPR